MKYYIEIIDREVELNQEIVEEFFKFDTLRDSIFAITIIAKYGDNPTTEVISDEELSHMCNQILISRLKTFALLPKAIEIIDTQLSNLSSAAKEGKLLEYKL